MVDTQRRVPLRGSSVNSQRERETFLSGGTTHVICVDERAKEQLPRIITKLSTLSRGMPTS
jgi:hypothetical protein